METTIKLLLVSGDQLFRFGAFIAVVYFASALYRARIEGSSYLLFGCIAMLLGEGAKVRRWSPSQALGRGSYGYRL